MKTQTFQISNLDLLFLMDHTNHLMYLIWQRELNKHHIPVRQYQVLRKIKEIGSDATIAKIAGKVEREVDVISRQVASMEKDGLIKRIQDTPKSRLFRIQLTKKGLDKLKIADESQSIDMILSTLTKEERKRIHTVLKKISNTLEKHSAIKY